jgi:hypothetical protein
MAERYNKSTEVTPKIFEITLSRLVLWENHSNGAQKVTLLLLPRRSSDSPGIGAEPPGRHSLEGCRPPELVARCDNQFDLEEMA